MILTAIFFAWLAGFLAVAPVRVVHADCGPSSPTIQERFYDKYLQDDALVRVTVFSVNATGISCESISEPPPHTEIQIEEIFRGNLSVGDSFPVLWDTDTGYRADLPQDLVNAGAGGFLAFLRLTDRCTAPVYTLNECLWDVHKPWSEVSSKDKEFLRNPSSSVSIANHLGVWATMALISCSIMWC